MSLAFGGRPGAGRGFAIPLVLRYLLEVCRTVADVRVALTGLPVAMSYNVTVLDANAATLTAYLTPDEPAEFSFAPLATNHRGAVPEYPEIARSLRSVERRAGLVELSARRPGPEELAAAFLSPPLYRTAFSRAFGTLYTALYRPELGCVEYLWPGRVWRRYFDDPDASTEIQFQEAGRSWVR
jgi:predicted choloylglycine hydrolase